MPASHDSGENKNEAAFWEDLTQWLHLVLAKMVVVNSS